MRKRVDSIGIEYYDAEVGDEVVFRTVEGEIAIRFLDTPEAERGGQVQVFVYDGSMTVAVRPMARNVVRVRVEQRRKRGG